MLSRLVIFCGGQDGEGRCGATRGVVAVLQTSVFQLSVLTKNKQILETDDYELYCRQDVHARMGTIVEAAVRMSNDYRRDVAECSFPSTNGYRRFIHTSQE